MSSTTRLTSLNILNVLAYIANAVVTYGIGVAGLGGTPTNAELSQKYQTLVTPIGAVFSIWAIIFISQFIFAIAQLLGPYRQDPLVTKGVGRYYIGACLAQVGWTLAFTYEVIWLSLIFMLSILFFLVSIVVTQYKTQEKTANLDYWLLKFPFAIHCGWIIAASFVNLSVVFVAYGLQATLQYYYAFATVGCVFLIAVAALRYPDRAEYVIPVVLAWATVRPMLGDSWNTKTLTVCHCPFLAHTPVVTTAPTDWNLLRTQVSKRLHPCKLWRTED
jgi:translocator protein